MASVIEAPVVEYPIADAAIEALAAEFMPLAIEGADDKDGYRQVHDARMVVREKRVDVEKKRKELKAGALEYGRRVDAEAKRLTSLLEPIERHLKGEEDSYKEEVARIKREAEEKRVAALKEKADALAAYGVLLPLYEIEELSDADYQSRLADAKAEQEKRLRQEEERKRKEAEERERQQRLAAEEAERRRKEEERLKVEREKLAAEQRRQEEERQKLEVERLRLEAEAEEARRQAELEKAKAEAAERAQCEERERQEREAAEAKEREERERAERERREALRPDREKLALFADQVEKLEIPAMSEAMGTARDRVARILLSAAQQIRTLANEAQ